MKLNLSKEEKKILNEVIIQKERNIQASEWVSEFLSEYYDAFSLEDIEKAMADGSTKEEALTTLFDSLIDYEEEEDESELRTYCDFGHIRLLEDRIYSENPYLKTVKVKEGQNGKVKLSWNYYAPYECFPYDETKLGKNGEERIPLGCFEKKFPYLVLTDEKNVVWMSVTPYEINTMKEAIEDAKGNVLTFGLGLGYYAFMAANKKEVTSVTIIDNDASVIRIFEERILPFFPHKEKIHIQKGDAFALFPKSADYDSIFVDIYRASEDALPLYFRFKSMEKKTGITKPVRYWIENSILALLRRYVLTLFQENLLGLGKEAYQSEATEEDRIIRKLYYHLKEYKADSLEDIQKLLSPEGLRKLAAELK